MPKPSQPGSRKRGAGGEAAEERGTPTGFAGFTRSLLWGVQPNSLAIARKLFFAFSRVRSAGFGFLDTTQRRWNPATDVSITMPICGHRPPTQRAGVSAQIASAILSAPVEGAALFSSFHQPAPRFTGFRAEMARILAGPLVMSDWVFAVDG